MAKSDSRKQSTCDSTDPPYGVKEYNFDQMKNGEMATAGSGGSLHRSMVTTRAPLRVHGAESKRARSDIQRVFYRVGEDNDSRATTWSACVHC